MNDERNGRNSPGGPALRDYLCDAIAERVYVDGRCGDGLSVRGALAGAADAWLLAVLLASSSFLYMAGVVLNDFFDLELDLRERPDRPLPSGRISPRAALRLGLALMFSGALLG